MEIKLNSMLLFSLLVCLLSTSCNAKSSTVVRDTTINGKIKLRNSSSVENSFGDLMPKLDPDKDLPDICFRNIAGTEYLRMVFYPGDNKNAFSLFEISKLPFKNQKVWPSSFLSFTTESGIKLGISKAEVVKKKGKDYKETKSGNTTKLRYVIDEKKDKNFLSRYNMPLYFADYIFINDVLEKFTFGFEFP